MLKGDKTKQDAKKTFFNKILSSSNEVQRTITLETKPYAKQSQIIQGELAAMPNTCIIAKPLLSFAVAFKVHSY